MKVLVVCQECGKKILEAEKETVTEQDIREYEITTSCEEHGPNIFERDEDGLIVSQTKFVVKAIKKVD